MAEIIKPKKQSDPLSDSPFTLIGTGVGAMYGNPQAGAAIGGMVDQDQGNSGGAGGIGDLVGMAGGSAGGETAVDRRMQQKTAPQDLEKGMDALSRQDPALQQKYGPMLQAALEKSKGQQQQISQDALARRRARYNGGVA